MGFCYLHGMLIKVDLATALKKLRGSRTQKAVAEKAGLSPSTWNQYEKARRLPKEDSWPKVARGLECSLDEVWDEMVVAYQERTGGGVDRNDELAAVFDELVTQLSRQMADRMADQMANRMAERWAELQKAATEESPKPTKSPTPAKARKPSS